MKTKERNEDFIDLATTAAEDKSNSTTYLCQDCGSDLIVDDSFKNKNPFAGGIGYYCGSCNKVFDSSLVRLAKKPKPIVSTLGSNDDFMFESIDEDKGLGLDIEDPYEKYDPESLGDEQLKQQGYTIVRSEITLSDSNGNNRVLAKRIK